MRGHGPLEAAAEHPVGQCRPAVRAARSSTSTRSSTMRALGGRGEPAREWVTRRRPVGGPRRRGRSRGRTDRTSSSGIDQDRPEARATSNATVSGASTKVVKRSRNTRPLSQNRQDGLRAHQRPGRLRHPSRRRTRRRRAGLDDRRRHRHRPGHPQPVPAGDPHRPPAGPAGDQPARPGRRVPPRRCPASEISIARIMRIEQGFLAEVHGQRPEDVRYPGAASDLAQVWVAAREAYRRVLEGVTIADVVAGRAARARGGTGRHGRGVALVRHLHRRLTPGGGAGHWRACPQLRVPASPSS